MAAAKKWKAYVNVTIENPDGNVILEDEDVELCFDSKQNAFEFYTALTDET